MRVAVIVPGGVDASGTHRVIPALLWLLRRLTSHHEVHVFSMRGRQQDDRHTLEGATVHNIGGAGRRTARTIVRLLAVHRRTPFDLLHAFWASGPGFVGAIASRLMGKPMLLHVTGGDMVSIPAIEYGGCRTTIGRLRVHFALRAAARISAPSSSVADAILSAGRRVVLLPLGVDRRDWPPAAPRPRNGSLPARLVHVAHLNRVKDQRTLLRALARLVEAGRCVHLDVAGGDTLDGTVQHAAIDLGVESSTTFHGFMTQSALAPLVRAADLLVMSSRHEADPVAVLEAAMVGVPTVGTAFGHVRDWDPIAALAVPPGDDAALARCISELLDDDGRRLSIARAAHETALARDADWSAGEIMKLYAELNDGRA